MGSKDSSLILHIIKEVFSESVINCFAIEGLGIVNRTYCVRTVSCSYILRMNEGNDSYCEYQKEYWCMYSAKKARLSSSLPLAIGCYEGTAYLLESLMPGTNGSLLPQEATHIWFELGRMAKIIEQFPAEGFGLDFASDPNNETGIFYNSFSPTFESHIQYNLDSLTADDRLIALGVYTPGQRDAIHIAFLSLLEGYKSNRLHLGLLHGDLSPRNVLIEPDHSIHLIDWGCALIHFAPHYGFSAMYKEMLQKEGIIEADVRAFYLGYGLNTQTFLEMESDIKKILLLDSFDKLRWAIDQKQDEIASYADWAKFVVVWTGI